MTTKSLQHISVPTSEVISVTLAIFYYESPSFVLDWLAYAFNTAQVFSAQHFSELVYQYGYLAGDINSRREHT